MDWYELEEEEFDIRIFSRPPRIAEPRYARKSRIFEIYQTQSWPTEIDSPKSRHSIQLIGKLIATPSHVFLNWESTVFELYGNRSWGWGGPWPLCGIHVRPCLSGCISRHRISRQYNFCHKNFLSHLSLALKKGQLRITSSEHSLIHLSMTWVWA